MYFYDFSYNPIMAMMAQYNNLFMPNFYFGQNFYTNPFESIFQTAYNQGRINSSQESIFNSQNTHTKYHKGKADLLLKNVKEGLPEVKPVPPLCARYVKNAIVKSGLGEYINGNGEQSKYMLRNNLNFKEVSINNKKDLQKLPNGAVVVYDSNTPVSYKDGSTKVIGEDGHVGFKENNKIISDRIEELPLTSRAYAFIPV